MATCPGELPLSLEELAKQCETPEDAIKRSLGDRCVRRTRQPTLRLALSAAKACLQKAEISVTEIDAIIWFGDQPLGLRLQYELGAHHAYILFLAGYCSEMVTALRIARDLVCDDARHVLIVSEDRFDRLYTAQRPGERSYSDITSDAGSAILVDRVGLLELSAFGFATRSQYWDYWIRYHAFHEGHLSAEALPDPIAVSREEIITRRTALERCLRACGISLAQLDHFSLCERVTRPMLSLARQLGIPSAKVIAARYGHMGRCDVVFDLERLLEIIGPTSGARALLMTGTPGVCRCAALQWRDQ